MDVMVEAQRVVLKCYEEGVLIFVLEFLHALIKGSVGTDGLFVDFKKRPSELVILLLYTVTLCQHVYLDFD